MADVECGVLNVQQSAGELARPLLPGTPSMIKDLQVTLYDVFGFLLPGAVFLGGEAILYWAIFLPQTVIPIVSPSLGQWVILLSLAYLTGHIWPSVRQPAPKEVQVR